MTTIPTITVQAVADNPSNLRPQSEPTQVAWGLTMNALRSHFGTSAVITTQPLRPETLDGHSPASFETRLEEARDHLCGRAYPLDRFKAIFSEVAQPWQRAAFCFADGNPDSELAITHSARREIWSIRKRGTVVEFRQPHHGYGGDRGWISTDGVMLYTVEQD